MTQLALVKQLSGAMAPASPRDAEYLRKVKAGEVITSEWKKPRNGKHHRLAFVLLTIMFENQEKFANWEDMMLDVKIRCGHYDHRILEGGEVCFIPRSISYGSMDQTAFDEFYRKLVDVALSPAYLQGMDRDRLEAGILRRMEFA